MQQPQTRPRRRDRGLSISSQDGAAAITTKDSNLSSSGVSSTSTQLEGGDNVAVKKSSSKMNSSSSSKSSSASNESNHCFCGVVSLLECVPGSSGAERSAGGGSIGGGAQPDRSMKRTLRSKIREFNSRAQVAWGRSTRGSGGGALKRHGKSRGNVSGGTAGAASAALGGVPRRCYQPRHLPLPLNPSTRVTFAYELTSIAIVVDASPSLTATTFETSNMFDSGGLSEEKNGYCVVPLDRLGSLLKTYLQGLVQPIDVPPVAVSGLGVSFLRWTPNLAVTVVAAYPRTSQGDHSSAGLLVRDFRVSDVNSALELARQVERWALREVEGAIAERLSGERNFLGDGVAGRNIGIDHDDPMYPMLTSLGSYHLPQTQHIGSSVKSSMKELLAVGDAALSTLPPEGRPMVLVVTDCQNIHCGGVFESLASTDRTDVPLSVLNLSAYGSHTLGGPGSSGAEFSPFALSVSDDSQSIRDACHISGGIFLHQTLLETCVNTSAGSPIDHSSPLHGDYHFERAKRSIRPNALQWYTLFTLSPFTPSGASSSSFSRNGTTIYRSGTTAPISRSISTKQHQSHDSIGSFAGYGRQISLSSIFDNNSKANDSAFVAGADVSFTAQVATQHERTVFSKYAIQPIRIKSLLMTRVLEGYHARRYGHNTQDPDKVSVHMVLCLTDCGIAVHYEVSFVSSPYHAPMVGTAHVKLELSGDDVDFIQTVKRMFISHHGADSIMQQGRRISAVSKAAAEKICKLLRWIRKEDYLESYLCLPGWGDINHFADGSSFLRRLESLTSLQRYRHFRSETLEAVIAGGSPFENRESLFGDIMEPNNGEDEMFSALSSWSTGIISDRKIYLKEVFPAQDDDLAYYCIVRVLQSPVVSRLFTFTLDFHGELDTEQRLMVLSSFRENLKGCTDIIVLKKTISENIAIRPSSPSHLWHPGKREYFLHHKSWDLIKDTEVLPLITKRRSQIGNFFILHADDDRAVFAKFVQSDGLTTPDNLDIVIYQVLSRPDGIFVDIHMESCRSTFYPFYANDTIFHSIFEKVKRRDKECAKNLRSRTNVLAALDPGNFDQHAESQTEDVHRLIRVSTLTQRKLRFFRGVCCS